MSPSYEAHLRGQLEDACLELAFERSDASLCAAVERQATSVLHRERETGRCRDFAVKCTLEAGQPVLEVAYRPPGARVRTLRLHLEQR